MREEWNRIVADEDARVNRYRHPATVVIIELDGFDRLVADLGPEAGDRVLPALADTLSRNARGADHLARLGPTRFGILLPETDEIEAINYVERVREACDLWLESGAIALHLLDRLGESRPGFQPRGRGRPRPGADVRGAAPGDAARERHRSRRVRRRSTTSGRRPRSA